MSVNMNSGMVTIGENIGGGVPVFYCQKLAGWVCRCSDNAWSHLLVGVNESSGPIFKSFEAALDNISLHALSSSSHT